MEKGEVLAVVKSNGWLHNKDQPDNPDLDYALTEAKGYGELITVSRKAWKGESIPWKEQEVILTNVIRIHNKGWRATYARPFGKKDQH